MKDTRTQFNLFNEAEKSRKDERTTGFSTRNQVFGHTQEVFSVESPSLSAPMGGDQALVEAATLNPSLQLNFEEQHSPSTVDLATSAATLISSSITDSSNVLSDWGIGEGIGTGDVGVIGGGHGAGCQCAACKGGGGRSGTNATGAFVNLDQVVFLDFDSGTDGKYRLHRGDAI